MIGQEAEETGGSRRKIREETESDQKRKQSADLVSTKEHHLFK